MRLETRILYACCQPHGGRLVRRAAAICGLACLLAAAAGRPVVAQAPSDLPAGRAVIDRFVDAIGGAETLRKVRSQRAVGTFEVPGPGITGQIEVLSAAPNLMRQRLVVPGLGTVESGYDGTVGWLDDPTIGPMVLDGKALAQMKVDADFYAALHREDVYQTVETVERTTFEGTDAYKLRLVTTAGDEQFEYFSVETGLLVGGQSVRALPMGEFPTTTVLTEYKTFGGLRLATRWVQRSMGVEQTITITNVEFDGVDPAIFALPARIKALVR
jgi:hypothetical protein